MFVYLAGEIGLPPTWWKQHVRRRLASYWYHGADGNKPSNELVALHQQGIKLFLDSGAYSAMSKGAQIHLGRYVDFCKQYGDMFEIMASLDVIGDAEKSWKAWHYMVDNGAKNIMPTFHYGEPWEYLDKMATTSHYMALGGLVKVPKPSQLRWLDEAWERLTDAQGKPVTKVHGFGLTTVSLMQRYPWYSVDSSSWIQSAAYGQAMLWAADDKTLLRMVFSKDSPSATNAEGWHYQALCMVANDPRKAVVDAALVRYGITAEEAIGHYSYRMALNAATYQQFETHAPETFQREQQGFF